MDNERIYPLLGGIGYIKYLKSLHESLKPEWYLEIGSFKGASLANSVCKTIAIDPFFQLSAESITGKPELHLFQCPSDDFFDQNKAAALTSKVDLAFLDGMHQFEFLLRDFIGAEKLCTNGSMIVMHDCVPISPIASERERQSGTWTGDVWKLVPILQKYRPDLTLKILDCPPSGLTIVTNLDPNNTALSDNYDQIVGEFLNETIGSFGTDRLWQSLEVANSRAPQ